MSALKLRYARFEMMGPRAGLHVYVAGALLFTVEKSICFCIFAAQMLRRHIHLACPTKSSMKAADAGVGAMDAANRFNDVLVGEIKLGLRDSISFF